MPIESPLSAEQERAAIIQGAIDFAKEEGLNSNTQVLTSDMALENLQTSMEEAKGEEPKVQVDEADQAAYTFQTLQYPFKRLIGMTSSKGLARVLKAIVEFPLITEKPKFMHPNEEQLFVILSQLLDAKGVMFFSQLKDKYEAEENEANAKVSQEQGEQNG